MEPLFRALTALGEQAAARPSGVVQHPSREVQRILSLHRYWRYCDRLRNLYLRSIKDKSPLGSKSVDDVMREFIGDFNGDPGLFMSYWYGSLHVVVEGYQRLGMRDPAVDALLSGDGKQKLRRLKIARHSTFHFQAEMMSPKLWEFLSVENVPWIGDLHDALGASSSPKSTASSHRSPTKKGIAGSRSPSRGIAASCPSRPASVPSATLSAMLVLALAAPEAVPVTIYVGPLERTLR